ncbi:MAG: type III-A CRISPR-associated protein Cas10/Csm1 [Epsilonproteobacteria bacterium]|nr:type III-A CRISPR-associated protein Cas10/Csm1 [Campylobacterota bacterium]NPA89767.1 type III-A CRISPR-associated protein Cas10/Csm1 [Campylobacterota bacterium]
MDSQYSVGNIFHLISELEEKGVLEWETGKPSKSGVAYFSPRPFDLNFIKFLLGEKGEKGGKREENSLQCEETEGKEIGEELIPYRQIYSTALCPSPLNGGELDPYRVVTQFYHHQMEKIKEKVEKRGGNFLYLSADFWGIQDFIFKRVSSKGASKMLRSRSAYIEILTYLMGDLLKKELEAVPISMGAGKVVAIAPVKGGWEKILEEIEKQFGEFFVNHFFGFNGVALVGVEGDLEILEEIPIEKGENLEERWRGIFGKKRAFRQKFMEALERKKYQKYREYISTEKRVIDIFEEAEEEDKICKYCNYRVGKRQLTGSPICDICFFQIKLGAALAKSKYAIFWSKEEKEKENFKSPYLKVKNSNYFNLITLKVRGKIYHYYMEFFSEKKSDRERLTTIQKSRDPQGVIFDISNQPYNNKEGYPKFPISSYTAKEGEKVKDFSQLAKVEGVEEEGWLMALKADVDKLGSVFRSLLQYSYKKTNRLSRELDFFFSNYLPFYLERSEHYQNYTYVIFSGGDDLFILGRYDKIVRLAKDIRQKFRRFTLGKATISMGLAMFKPSTPVQYISRLTDEAEQQAKNLPKYRCKSRNGISLFGVGIDFDEFLEIEREWKKLYTKLKEGVGKVPSSFLYRLIELTQMAERIRCPYRKKFNPKDALWHSKLAYTFRRNIGEDEELLGSLHHFIQKWGERILPSIQLTIYYRRDELEEEWLNDEEKF